MTELELTEINELVESFKKKKTRRVFDMLVLSIKMKFRQEEKLYTLHDHPERRIHEKMHKEFERVLKNFEHTYFNQKKQEKNTFKEFCLYVKNWLTLHIECYDKAMMPYIRINNFVQQRLTSNKESA